MMRFAVPTKFDVAGVGVSAGGKGVPIATGAEGGKSIDGSTGVVLNLLAIETSAPITKNKTTSRIRNFAAFTAYL